MKTVPEQLARLVGRARRDFMGRISRRLSKDGQSSLEWLVVNALVRDGPMAQVALAEATGQHAAGLSRLVSALEKRGWLARKIDSADRRKRVVVLTARGSRWYSKWHPAVVGSFEETVSTLNVSEQKQLLVLLKKLVGV